MSMHEEQQQQRTEIEFMTSLLMCLLREGKVIRSIHICLVVFSQLYSFIRVLH